MEFDFRDEIEALSKIKRKKDYLAKAEKLKHYILSQFRPWWTTQLAIELESRGIDISDLEDHLIKLREPGFLLSFALRVHTANIPKLQEAIVQSHSALNIAEFACWVKGADFARLEEVILEMKVPMGAYTLLCHRKNLDVEKFRAILMKSKRPRYLYQLSKFTTNPVQLAEIEDLILKSRSFFYMRLFFQHTPNASLSKLEDRVLATGNLEEIRKTYALTKSKRLGRWVMLS